MPTHLSRLLLPLSSLCFSLHFLSCCYQTFLAHPTAPLPIPLFFVCQTSCGEARGEGRKSTFAGCLLLRRGGRMKACAPSSVGKRQETAFKTRRGYKAGRHTLVSSKAQNFDVRSTRYLQNGKRWGNFAAWGGQNFRGPFSSPDNSRGTSGLCCARGMRNFVPRNACGLCKEGFLTCCVPRENCHT